MISYLTIHELQRRRKKLIMTYEKNIFLYVKCIFWQIYNKIVEYKDLYRIFLYSNDFLFIMYL